MDELIKSVKLSLRITNDAFNQEIEELIASCKMELSLAGITKLDEADPLINRAIIIYCKANFGYSEDSEKFHRSYNCLKASLSLAGDYSAKEDKVTVL
ncbi:MAG: DNA-packaging protein [Clostridiales bacterium]|jgi:hypothetical protein|nr:DNA-packaging protein [Clostridiales bacterium]